MEIYTATSQYVDHNGRANAISEWSPGISPTSYTFNEATLTKELKVKFTPTPAMQAWIAKHSVTGTVIYLQTEPAGFLFTPRGSGVKEMCCQPSLTERDTHPSGVYQILPTGELEQLMTLPNVKTGSVTYIVLNELLKSGEFTTANGYDTMMELMQKYHRAIDTQKSKSSVSVTAFEGDGVITPIIDYPKAISKRVEPMYNMGDDGLGVDNYLLWERRLSKLTDGVATLSTVGMFTGIGKITPVVEEEQSVPDTCDDSHPTDVSVLSQLMCDANKLLLTDPAEYSLRMSTISTLVELLRVKSVTVYNPQYTESIKGVYVGFIHPTHYFVTSERFLPNSKERLLIDVHPVDLVTWSCKALGGLDKPYFLMSASVNYRGGDVVEPSDLQRLMLLRKQL